jgi:hypothetical protein
VKVFLICRDYIFHLGVLSKGFDICVSAPVSAASHGNSKGISRRNLSKDLSPLCWLCKENKRKTQWSFKGKWDIRYLYLLYILYYSGNIICCLLMLQPSYWFAYFFPHPMVLWEMCMHAHAHTHTHTQLLTWVSVSSAICNFIVACKQSLWSHSGHSILLSRKFWPVNVSSIHAPKTPSIWKSRMCTLYAYNCNFNPVCK